MGRTLRFLEELIGLATFLALRYQCRLGYLSLTCGRRVFDIGGRSSVPSGLSGQEWFSHYPARIVKIYKSYKYNIRRNYRAVRENLEKVSRLLDYSESGKVHGYQPHKDLCR